MTAPTYLGRVGTVAGSAVGVRQAETLSSGIAIIGVGPIASVRSAALSGFRRDITISMGSFQRSGRTRPQKRFAIPVRAASDG